ncbi:MAG: PLP-dependent transferase [Capnocytophaga sp.]|nr:PLP-dependent transferase [Capnocytophaga sp.]
MKKSYESKVLHKSFERPDVYHSIAMPVYHSVAFEFDSAEAMEDAFLNRSTDHTYSRITNPTVQHFEQKVQEITRAYSVTALNSGMAAISNTFMEIAYAGANIVTSAHLFGNTFSILNYTLKEFGVETRFCDLTNPEDVRKNIDENTCCLFLEIITNPQLEVADLSMLSSICKEKKIPLIADTTIIPFHVFDAKSVGVDIELVSSTKYISGGATSTGGLIIDYGTFDWSYSKRLKSMAEKVGNAAFKAKLRLEIHRNIGAYMTPQTAHLQLLGLETLALRYEKQAATALSLAKALEESTIFEYVNYIGLPSNPFHTISKKQFGNSYGAMLTIDLASRKEAFHFLNHLKLIRRATNLFDNRSLAIHPASTIYGTLSAEQRKAMDVSDKTVRLSVGLEGMEDLLEDILQAVQR